MQYETASPLAQVLSASWKADDWSALGSMVAGIAAALAVVAAIIALFFAWRQLGELIRSNDQLAASNATLMRPIVVVDYDLVANSSRNPEASTSSTVFVVVRNIGRTPARDVTLKVNPPFATMSEAVAQHATPFLNEIFSGQSAIRMLTLDRPLKYVLDNASKALASKTLPGLYVVTVKYSDMSGKQAFEETYELEMAPWALSVAEEKPLRRLSKDLQAIRHSLDGVTRA